MVFYNLTVMIVTLLILGYASQKFVGQLTRISAYLKLPKFALSFVVLGLGTSLPDLVVASIASSQDQAELVIGSIIGSNIIILCLVLGVVAIRKGRFKVRETTVIDNFGWIFFVLLIPFFLLLDGKLTRIEGFILVAVYVMYLYNIREQESLAAREKEFHESEEQKYAFKSALPLGDPLIAGRRSEAVSALQKSALPATQLSQKQEAASSRKKLWTIAKAIALLGIIFISSNGVVEQAIAIVNIFNLPPALFGMSIVALGLALPEFAVDLSALKAREEEIVWGDVIGSFITELTLVLGAAAIFASNLVFDFSKVIVAYSFMAVVFLLVFFFAYQKKELTRSEGIALIILYVVFLSIQLDFFINLK